MLAIADQTRFANQIRNPLSYDLPTTVVGSVRVGNHQYPSLPYNSSNDGFVRMYNALLEVNGKNSDKSWNSWLTFERFKSIYPVMLFDCSANMSSFENQFDSEIVVDLTLSGQPANYSLVAIVLSDEAKQMTEQGSVIRIESGNLLN
jgi:hypothetical protein